MTTRAGRVVFGLALFALSNAFLIGVRTFQFPDPDHFGIPFPYYWFYSLFVVMGMFLLVVSSRFEW